VAFVNPDCTLARGTFAPILDVFARQSNARLVGGRLQHPNGREQRGGRREFLTPWRAFVEVTRLDLFFPRHPYFRRFNMLAKSLMLEPTVVPVVSGAFMMMRRDYYQRIGGMDENFFLHCDDLDLCLRVHRHRGEVWLRGKCADNPLSQHQRCAAPFGRVAQDAQQLLLFQEAFPGDLSMVDAVRPVCGAVGPVLSDCRALAAERPGEDFRYEGTGRPSRLERVGRGKIRRPPGLTTVSSLLPISAPGSQLVLKLLTGELQPSARFMWWIFWVGAASFLPLLFLQYVGEEAVYTILAQELRARKDLTVTTLYGGPYGRASAYAWLILALAGLLGADNILVAARLMTAASTVLMGLTLAWLVHRLFKDRLLAAFSAAAFLSGDVLLYLGWLAYADPCFAFFTFAAMACLWVATEEGRPGLLLLAALALMASFLAKALTGYVFYGVLGLVLLWHHQNRMFLLSPASLLAHIVAAGFPLFWDRLVASTSIMGFMTGQILPRFDNPETPNLAGAAEFLVSYPVRLVWLLLPLSALTLYCVARRTFPLAEARNTPIHIAAWTVLLNAPLLADILEQPPLPHADLSPVWDDHGVCRSALGSAHARDRGQGPDRDDRHRLRRIACRVSAV
jgi:hypothetical protein